MFRAVVLPLLLVWALLPTFSRPVRAEPPPQQPASDSKDLCSYLKDVEAKADEDCGADNLAALKSQDPAAYVRKVELARGRKPEVLKVYDLLRAQPWVLPQLDPPINERTFPAWVGPEAKDLKEVSTRWLQAQNQELRQEKQNPVSPERRKEIDAKVAKNEARIMTLAKINDPGELSCFLGESCGARPDLSGTSVSGVTAGNGSWRKADYKRANEQANRQNRVPGGKIDRGVPALGMVASEVASNTPLGPLVEKPAGGGGSGLGTVATIALATTGALLLFGGLGGRALKEKFPNIRRDMGIAALIGGTIATGAVAWTRVAATALPVALNPATREKASETIVKGQQVVQRVVQSAQKITPKAQAGLQRIGSGLTTQAGRLLNAQQAQIDPRKFTEYALNPNSSDGMHKAQVFKSVLGYTRENYQSLIEQIRSGILSHPAIKDRVNEHGKRYTVDILVEGPLGKAVVRTGWIYSPGSEIPRLTTAFIKK